MSVSNRRHPESGWLLATLVGLLTTLPTLAQQPDPSFERFTTDEGLASDYVTALLKDRRGFLWVGTSNGLSRFDGQRFKTYRRRNVPNSLLGNYVVNEGLTEAPDGILWIATNRGLCRFDPVSEQFRAIPIPPQRDGQADNDYTSPLRFDRQGFGWFSSKYSLYRLDPKTDRLTAYPLPTVIDNAYAEAYIDRRGRCWLNHAGRLYQFDPGRGQFRHCLAINRQQQADSTVQFRSFYEDAQGRLLLSGSQGVWQFEASRNAFIPAADLPTSFVLALQADRLPNGQAFWWLGGGPSGLMAHVPGTQHPSSFERHTDDRLSHNGGAALTFLRDPQSGIVWIGTDMGLEKVDRYAIRFRRKLLTPASSNARPAFVASVRPDTRDDNTAWLAVRGMGLVRWNRQSGALTPVSFGTQPERRDALSVAQDGRGRVWVGMRGGVGRYDPASGRADFINAFIPASQRAGQGFSAVFADRQGRVWLGSEHDGLFWYDPETDRINPWPLPTPPRLGFVRRIQEDSRGRIWVLTGAGLYQLDPPTGQTRHVLLHGAPIQPTDLLQSTFSIDRHDGLWVSGIGFVARADTSGRVQRTYTLANGLQAEHTFGIQDDAQGHIWLATDDRLHELDPRTGRFRYYDKGSGLIEKMVFQPGELSLNRRGELFIGYSGGFNYVQTADLHPNPTPPPVVITDLRINNVPRSLATPVVLQPGETTLTLDFVALNFSRADQNQYAYRLDGFDQNWVPTTDRQATYTNLAPGTYTFRVKAANNDGVWNPTGAALTLRVAPAYWQTGWFRLLCGALVLGILYAIYQNREAQRRRLDAVRERIAKDLHDDIGSTLSSIRVFSDVVQAQIAPVRPEAVPLLQRISTNATTLSESMQDIIWTVQPKNNRLQDVITRLREFGLRMAEAKDIRFTMQVADAFDSLTLDMEQRRNLYLIGKESINNAIKYANCSRIDITLSLTGRQLRMTIQDDGVGFDAATAHAGNGLANLHQRARDIGGTLHLTTASGQGTRIDLELTV
ncbi:histidine kinase [Fibrella aestuarina BUZ 2]|uniref:Histidine kinase n=1 Tax=Fibrella aestuarina BUZ 2 TaxID=1166018 RepID=I0KG68_9BACT|nr:sensor histidine kinase [Fibrella aestuarina]CCH03121.1 histidine kinase [Fibrella aestuarina BUZ 2]